MAPSEQPRLAPPRRLRPRSAHSSLFRARGAGCGGAARVCDRDAAASVVSNVCGCAACTHICIHLRAVALEAKRRVLDPPEMELQKIVSGHAGPRNRTRGLCKSNQSC